MHLKLVMYILCRTSIMKKRIAVFVGLLTERIC